MPTKNPMQPSRRRQTVLVLIAGIAGLFMVSYAVMYMPYDIQLLAGSDGKSVFLTAGIGRPEGPPQSFRFAKSENGSVFGKPAIRSGLLTGTAALDGSLYCVFEDNTISAISDAGWKSVGRPGEGALLGVAVFDNHVNAFTQKGSGAPIVRHALDNDVWQEKASYAYDGDNVLFVMGAATSTGQYLLMLRSQPESEKKPEHSWSVARIGDNSIEMLPSPGLERDVSVSLAADNESLLLLSERVRGPGPGRPAFEGTIELRRFRDGSWSKPRKLNLGAHAFLKSGDFAIVNHRGQLFLYATQDVLGWLFAGVYGVELRGDAMSAPFVVWRPLPEQTETEIIWVAALAFASFTIAGGLAGRLRLKALEASDSAAPPLALASVVDRASAAGIDFALVALVMKVTSFESRILEYWISVAIGLLIYGVVMETVSSGRTIGKKLLGLRVVGPSGERLALATVVKRNVLKLPEMLTVGVGTCLVSKRLQRLGDVWAGTVVVKENIAERKS